MTQAVTASNGLAIVTLLGQVCFLCTGFPRGEGYQEWHNWQRVSGLACAERGWCWWHERVVLLMNVTYNEIEIRMERGKRLGYMISFLR